MHVGENTSKRWTGPTSLQRVGGGGRRDRGHVHVQGQGTRPRAGPAPASGCWRFGMRFEAAQPRTGESTQESPGCFTMSCVRKCVPEHFTGAPSRAQGSCWRRALSPSRLISRCQPVSGQLGSIRPSPARWLDVPRAAASCSPRPAEGPAPLRRCLGLSLLYPPGEKPPVEIPPLPLSWQRLGVSLLQRLRSHRCQRCHNSNKSAPAQA